MVVATGTDLSGVNTLISGSSAFSRSIQQLLFLQLFQEQPDFNLHPPTFEPELAQDWQWSEDGKILTIRLRTDVRWSDGEPVTAADVVGTWQAQIHPEVAWGLADSKENIVSLEAIDTHTLQVTYRQRSVTQLADLNEGVILPMKAWSRLPLDQWRGNADWFLENLVTNGPFGLDSWDRQQEFVLLRNPSFHVTSRPLLDSVVFRVVPQKVNQVGHLLSGDVDFVNHIPAADAQRVAESADHRIVEYWPRQYNFIAWNLTRPPFDQAATRRALTQAIDRQALVEALWFGHARVASSPIISSVWAHNQDLQPWPYDTDEARQLLAAQGWRDTDADGLLDRGGEPLTFELVTNSESAVRVDAAVMIQEQLRRAGVQVSVQRLEFNTVSERLQTGDFDAVLAAWTIDTSLDLDYAFHSDSIDGGYNFGGFVDPEVDRLLDQARDQTDAAEKGEILRQVQVLLHDQQPYTFLWEPQRLTGLARDVREAQPNALDPFFDLQSWWLEPTR